MIDLETQKETCQTQLAIYDALLTLKNENVKSFLLSDVISKVKLTNQALLAKTALALLVDLTEAGNVTCMIDNQNRVMYRFN